MIQPDGGVIHQRLDERGLPTEIIDADGVVNRFTWDSDGQLVATHDAFGAATEFDYDPYGYLRGIAPATGNPTVMELAPGGRVLRTTCGRHVGIRLHRCRPAYAVASNRATSPGRRPSARTVPWRR